MGEGRDPRYLRPNVALSALPEDQQKTAGIAEIRDSELIKFIELRGNRLIWTRAAACPCNPNEETAQPDPVCPKCNSVGWYYFGPEFSKTSAEVGELTRIQEALLCDNGKGAIIRGLTQKMELKSEPYTSIGTWDTSEAMVTVRPENKLGYYDRLINIDSVYPYTEVVQAPNPDQNDAVLPLKYRAVGINRVESVSTVYFEGGDFSVRSDGRVAFLEGREPAEGTRLSVHYLIHPVYLVTSHPHAIRNTSELAKISNPRSSLGSPVELPIQARIHLDFLIDTSANNG